MKKYQALFIAGIVACSAAAFGNQTIVSSNNPGGDAFTWAGNSPDGIQAIGTSGWYYANVRNGSTVGIDSTNPDTALSPADGSVHFQMPNNGAGPTGKADVEYYAWDVTDTNGYSNSAGLGTLGNLTSFSYDWYKSGSSTTSAATAPALRLILSNGGSDFHFLVFEDYTNGGGGTSVSNQWVHDDVTSTSQLWLTHDGGDGSEHLSSLAQWMSGAGFDTAINANTKVMGISVGVGSGWSGSFDGYADNVSIGFNGDSTTYNFEPQAVPEPAAFVMPILLGGFAFIKSRARS